MIDTDIATCSNTKTAYICNRVNQSEFKHFSAKLTQGDCYTKGLHNLKGKTLEQLSSLPQTRVM